MENRLTTTAFNRFRVWLLIGLALTPFIGCGGSKAAPGMASATGAVTFQDKPVSGANVTFYPAGGGDAARASQAITNDEGKFQLVTQLGGGRSKPGIPPGHYDVAITKLDLSGVTSTTTPPKNVLPRKYDNPKTSKLSADVKFDAENSFDFPLKAE